MSDSEQNKTQDATPFKLKRARQRGNVARGSDLAFLSTLVALIIFLMIFANDIAVEFSTWTRHLYSPSILNEKIRNAASRAQNIPLISLCLIGATTVLTVVFFEIIQLKGLNFSAHPLKPDFNRLNPAKGLKRIFSGRTLKEAIKSILKLLSYAGYSILISYFYVIQKQITMIDAPSALATLMPAVFKLLFGYAGIALCFATIDQVIARQEFAKQMRMSRSEVDRENKDREGEPRLKQKRKQTHAELAKQQRSEGALPGSDVVIVNPQHYAVALRYRSEVDEAPVLTTKGRNLIALRIKKRATSLGIPIIEAPKLARELFAKTQPGSPIPDHLFHPVASIYIKLQRRGLYRTAEPDQTEK